MFGDGIDIILKKLNGWWVKLVAILPNALLAAIVIVAFVFLAKFVRNTTFKIFTRMIGKSSISSLLSAISYVVVMALGMFVALDILQLDKAVSSLLAGAGILGLVIGFAFQDLSANFISGLFIALKRPFEVGQVVETNGYMGHIEDIQLRTTTIRTFQGLHLMIPNKDIFQKPMINYSLSDERRIELEFSVPSDRDLNSVKTKVIGTIEGLEFRASGKPVEVYYTGLGGNEVKMAVWFWINNHKDHGFMVARHEAIIRVLSVLKEDNVSNMNVAS